MNEIKATLSHEELDKLKVRIAEDIRMAGPISGTEFTNGKWGTVSFSTILKNGMNLSMSAYSPDAQGDAVSHCIASCGTAQELLEMIKKILGANCVEFQGEEVRLNENTIKVLSSYLKGTAG